MQCRLGNPEEGIAEVLLGSYIIIVIPILISCTVRAMTKLYQMTKTDTPQV